MDMFLFCSHPSIGGSKSQIAPATARLNSRKAGTPGHKATLSLHAALPQQRRHPSPDQTIQQAAEMMAEIDAGALPVGENDRLVGMITDRDIAIRAVAKGLGASTKVRDVMTREIHYCFEDQDVEEVAEKMSDLQVRRLPLLNREKRLVGIVALGDIAAANDEIAGEAICEISEPGGRHSQSMEAHP
jgi:Mg/Co/Ni transporter MgtE